MNDEQSKQKGKGARHRDALYDKARLELAVLEYLENPQASGTCRPVAVRTLAELFDMALEDMAKLLDELRKADVVAYNKHKGTAALLPLPA